MARYRRKVSGPLLDRIDLHVDVPPVPSTDLQSAAASESTAAVRSRVVAARRRQLERTGDPRLVNAALPARLAKATALSAEAHRLLGRAVERLGLSARAFHRVIRVALTIADLEGAVQVETAHAAEALRFRPVPAEASRGLA